MSFADSSPKKADTAERWAEKDRAFAKVSSFLFITLWR